MDGFTVELMLTAIKNGASEESVIEIYKSLTSQCGTGPSEDIKELVTSMIGTKVRIKGTSYTGVVDSLNNTRHGIYNGGRFPFNVKIDEGNGSASGKVFEYSVDQVIPLSKSSTH